MNKKAGMGFLVVGLILGLIAGAMIWGDFDYREYIDFDKEEKKIELQLPEVVSDYIPKLFMEDVPSPKNRIPMSYIHAKNRRFCVDIPEQYDSRYTMFTDSNSMDPVLDIEANAIEIIPNNSSDIIVGDIISFLRYDNRTVVHRVVNLGIDKEGWFAETKGDNVPDKDFGKVRFKDVKGIVVAIIY